MRICFLGGYDASYPRNVILRKGLAASGGTVMECRVPPSRKFWWRYPLLFLRYLQHFRKHDVFLVPEFCQKDLPLARFLSILTRKKIIFDPLAPRYETKILDRGRGLPGSLMAWWNHVLDSWSFRFSDLVLADTQAHKNYYTGEYSLSPAEIAVLPVGFDDEVFKPLKSPKPEGHAQPSRHFSVLFFGSFLPLHGVDSIIRAAAILSGRASSIRFNIVGSGQTLPGVRCLAQKSGLTNIVFEGWRKPDEIPGKIAEAEVCLGIFGRTEKAGRVVPHKIFQAMAMRRPVITASTPAVREFFKHGDNIYLCSEPYPDTLAEAILELERNPELRGRIAEAGFHLVRDKYTPQALGKRLLCALDNHIFLHPFDREPEIPKQT